MFGIDRGIDVSFGHGPGHGMVFDDSNLSRATGEYDAQMRLVEAGEEKNGEGRKGASRQGGGSGDGTATSSGP